MECLRCGNCCRQHPAFVSPGEIQRIIVYLGITMNDWQQHFAGDGPGYHDHLPVRQVKGACVFLRKRGSQYACAIHPVKPDCCVDWEPDLEKKECREGMERMGR